MLPNTDRTASTSVQTWSLPADAGCRDLAVAVGMAFLFLAPALTLAGWRVHGTWREHEEARLAAIEREQAHERLVAAPAAAPLEVAEAIKGRDLFNSTCIACHGVQGTGVAGLGKNLVESDFVALQSDEQLRHFIVTGRPDAKPMPMPPKAGREDLTEADIRQIVVYVRGLQDPRRMPALPAAVAAAPSDAQKGEALQAAGGDAELAGYIAHGNTLFHTTCIACHGKAGAGIAGNGKMLAKNEFVKSLDDDALLAFIKQGRSPSDPKNTTGIQMPPKGGNPAMSDDDILDVIAYLRTLQDGTKTASSK